MKTYGANKIAANRNRINIITTGGKSWVINLPTGKELEAISIDNSIST